MSLYSSEDVLLCLYQDESLFYLMEYTEIGDVSTFETGKLNYK